MGDYIINPKKYFNKINQYKQKPQNPFYKKYLFIPGTKNKVSQYFNQQPIYQSLNAKKNQYSLYFSRYRLDKLRRSTQEINYNSLILIPNKQLSVNSQIKSYSNYQYSPEKSFKDNPYNHNKKSRIQIEEQKQSRVRNRGMFADIYTKLRQNPNSLEYNGNAEDKIFQDIINQIQQNFNDHQSQQDTYIKGKRLFFDVYSRIQKEKVLKQQQQEIIKGKGNFVQIYQKMQRLSEPSEHQMNDNEQVIKARAIFIQACLKIVEGIRDEHKIEHFDKAKRLYNDSFQRIQCSLSNEKDKEKLIQYQYEDTNRNNRNGHNHTEQGKFKSTENIHLNLDDRQNNIHTERVIQNRGSNQLISMILNTKVDPHLQKKDQFHKTIQPLKKNEPYREQYPQKIQYHYKDYHLIR